MSNIENCADCGKRFGFTERIFSKTNGLWVCEDCAIKQIQENDNKDKIIADLEAKLAESNENVKLLAETRVVMCDTIKDLETKLTESEKDRLVWQVKCKSADGYWEQLGIVEEENKQLKQKLTEKDKEIEKILKENETLMVKHKVYRYGDEIQQDGIYAVSGEALDFLINNQDKISFAVEQLEKVKEVCDKVWGLEYEIEAVEDYIDNQIKQLKEGK